MTNEEEFIASFLRRWIDDEEIVGLNCPGDQALANQHFVGAADGIAQPGSPFEVQLLGSLEHLTAQAVQKVFAFTTQEGAYLLDRFAICG